MTRPHELTEEEQIDAALAALDHPQAPDPSPLTWEHDVHAVASRTLAELEQGRRPKAKTVCETCPNSVWFTSPTEVQCYCRVMFLVTWSTKAPNPLTACDGVFLGQE